jgi:hypothetical protein
MAHLESFALMNHFISLNPEFEARPPSGWEESLPVTKAKAARTNGKPGGRRKKMSAIAASD